MIPMPKDGNLLIAPPTIPDTRFRKSVLVLTNDNLRGSFALCINKPTNHTLKDLLEDTGIETELNFPLYWGGPVNPNTIWMLHSSEWSCAHTVPINDDWSVTSHMSMFHHLADGDYPEHFRLMYGYSSWAQGQLKAELRGTAPWNPAHSWLVAENPGPGWLFEQPVEDVWMNSTELSGHQAVDTWL